VLPACLLLLLLLLLPLPLTLSAPLRGEPSSAQFCLHGPLITL